MIALLLSWCPWKIVLSVSKQNSCCSSPNFLRIDLINKMSLLIQAAIIEYDKQKKKEIWEKKSLQHTNSLIWVKAYHPGEFWGCGGKRLKKEPRKKMGGSEKKASWPWWSPVHKIFLWDQTPCGLMRRIHTDSAGAGLSQVKRRAIHFPKTTKSMFY